MPQFSSKDKLRSGVPFGGFGAGKFEVMPTGLFDAFTFLNNWSDPVKGTEEYPGVLGYHWGIFVEHPKKKTARLLQTIPIQNIPLVRSIDYEGDFAKATLRYHDPSLGVEATLSLLSPWIPGDEKNTSLPVCYLNWSVRNTSKVPLRVGLLFIGRNVAGHWSVGRENRIEEDSRLLHLEFANEDVSKKDSRSGSLRFSFEKRGWQLSYIKSWNAVTVNFQFNPHTIRLLAWDIFSKEGRLPNSREGQKALGENFELCGAVAASATIKPGATKKWRAEAAWYFPHHAFGHRYASRFKSLSALSAYVSKERATLESKTERVRELVLSLPFPRWFNEALLTNLYPMFSSSWYTADGRTAMYESPLVCPLMGTIDVGFYGSIPLAYFFPRLELAQIKQFAAVQRPDGYIPHDLGRQRIDQASNGTTFYLWKDLNLKYILMVYRDYLWSKDKAYLKSVYDTVKRALNWTVKTDTNGDGLPDHGGPDHTFDLWAFEGANAYTSSLFLAALLACQKMAVLENDPAFKQDCVNYYLRARNSFEKILWNGRYFGKTCTLFQLNGQWYADLLGLGPIADPAKIQKALAFILKMNSRHSRYGLVNSVLPDGILDTSNDHARNIWGGMNYAFLALCISQGFPIRNLLKQAHKMWENVTKNQRSPWNQPDMIDSKTGRYLFGDYYYRNMAIWSLPIAYAARDKRTRDILRKLKNINEA